MATMMEMPQGPLHEAAPEISTHNSIREGWPQPLGAQERDNGVNFAIFSRDASGVRLELFNHPADSVAAR
jgi:glycogen operon protein